MRENVCSNCRFLMRNTHRNCFYCSLNGKVIPSDKLSKNICKDCAYIILIKVEEINNVQ